jgi:uncharacterized protein (TIGR02996 family)
MGDGELLLRAILGQPKEETPRLVYADWLEENGRPERAEFIRVQVELARLEAAWEGRRKKKHKKRDTLRRREWELLNGVSGDRLTWAEWSQPLWNSGILIGRPWFERMTYSRGFVSHVSCSWPDWRTHADAILAAQPVERVRLTTPAFALDGLTRFPQHPLTAELLGDMWPGIDFEVPPPVPPAVPLDGWRIEFDREDVEIRPGRVVGQVAARLTRVGPANFGAAFAAADTFGPVAAQDSEGQWWQCMAELLAAQDYDRRTGTVELRARSVGPVQATQTLFGRPVVWQMGLGEWTAADPALSPFVTLEPRE